jgi:two-component system response regulator FixJ
MSTSFSPPPVRQVHVIDDDDAVLRGISLLLGAAHIEAVTHRSGADFLASLNGEASSNIGCVLTDLRMPGLDGLDVLARLNEARLACPVIVMTAHGDISTAVRAMKTGAFDFIEKPFDDSEFLGMIERALSLPAPQAEPAEPRSEEAEAAARIAGLPKREREVLQLLTQGKANKAIAIDLNLSPRTVEVHRARLMARMGAHSLAEAVRIALLAERHRPQRPG